MRKIMPQEESPYQLTGHPTRNHRPLYKGQDYYNLPKLFKHRGQDMDVGVSENLSTLFPTLTLTAIFVTTRSTPAFLITALKCHVPRYYFPPLHRHRQPESRNTTRTGPPLYIRVPKPHPISPNIPTQLHCCSLANQHPPDICTPRC